MSSPTRKLNGRKPANPLGCGHPDCEVSRLLERLVEDTQRQLAEQAAAARERADALGEALGRIESELRSLRDSQRGMALHLSDVGSAVVLAGQRGELYQRELELVIRLLPPREGVDVAAELAKVQTLASGALGGRS